MKHLPNYKINIIPHKEQSYDSAGDYGVDWITISKMERWEYEALVLIHEMVEIFLCQKDGVKLRDIDYFDKEGEGKNHPDPGTLKSAPYHKQHKFATKIEKMLCKEFGISWLLYDKSFEKLVYKKVDKSKK